MSKIFSVNNIQKQKVILTIGVVAAAFIVAILVAAGMYLVGQNKLSSVVKDELKKAASVMEVEKNKIGGYPATIDGLVYKSDKVKLTGGGNFDGVSYCITGISTADETTVFHIDSTKSTSDILNGSCESNSDTLIPSIPTGVAVAFASSDAMKLTWNKAIYAKSYTLQCSTSKEFDKPVVVEVTDGEGVCTGLKPDTDYYYRVKATNSAGASAWSAESLFKTSK